MSGIASNINKYIVGDNIDTIKLVGNNKIDLIYFDPPYNTGRNFYNFDDRFSSIEDYLEFIELRIKECYRVLKKKGTIVIHIQKSSINRSIRSFVY